jgi:hypothetical protein
VSRLSPWLRRRLVTEEETVAAALAEHGAGPAEKFVQEVVWRSYFKGWLERRPSVWTAYRTGLAQDVAALERDGGLADRVAAAEAGRTGLDCLDAWAAELVETGYLHNHARMWFASLWIFTLGLPWRLGAAFFHRHLLDGDPASNTLGWRWVAGLHTPGKAYAARAGNIARFTDGRFRPAPGEIAETVVPLEEPGGLPPVAPLRAPAPPEPARASVLLITGEDCATEQLGLDLPAMRGAATLAAAHLRPPHGAAEPAARFEAGALADAAARAKAAGAPPAQALMAREPADLAAWARDHGATQIVTAHVPCGPLRDWLDAAAPSLDAAGVRLAETRRDWDGLVWPHCTAGFFRVKKKIPDILARAGLAA